MKLPALACIFLLTLFPFSASLAQGEAFHWYFGYDSTGLDFHTNPPSLLNNSPMQMLIWGGATLSDPCGNLVFYTNDEEVWNRNHQIMPNGTGLFGYPNVQTVVVPHPGNGNLYYIFTTGRDYINTTYPNEETILCYSVVDMSLQGGMGDVIMKNTFLEDSASGKIAGVQHSNQTDIWVVTLDGATDEFHAYLITASGLNPVPVISYVGPISTGLSYFDFIFLGQTKFSPDGKRLALTLQKTDTTVVLDFDPGTGIVSNPLFLPEITSSYNDDNTMGLEFSPDGSKLYRTYLNDSVMYQYDLNAGSPAAVINSVTPVGISTAQTGLVTMQLGPDGRIYVTREDGMTYTMDVIAHPNLPGTACTYLNQGINLFPGRTHNFTPTFLAHYLLPFEISLSGGGSSNGTVHCTGDTTFFSLSGVRGLDSALWDFGDPGSGMLNFANDPAPVHLYNTPGTYPVEVIIYRGCPEPDTLRDTLSVLPQPLVDLGPDSTLCSGTPLSLLAGNQPVNYLWQDGSTLNTFPVTASGLYWAEAANACGTFRDSILVNIDTLPQVELGVDTFLCPGSSFLPDITTSGASYLWQDSSTASQFLISASGLYWAEATNTCGSSRDSILVETDTLLPLSLGPDTTLCAGESLVLSGVLSSFSPLNYLWNDNLTDSVRTVSTAGLYVLTVSNACSSVKDSVDVAVLPQPQISLGSDQTLCTGETLLLSAAFPGGNYLWQDGTTDSVFLVSGPGTYSAALSTFCGTVADTVEIFYDPVPVVELGEDTILCEGSTLRLDATFPGATALWQNGSTASILMVSTAGVYSVTLTNTACEFRDTLVVTYQPLPVLSLGADTLLCDGATLEVNVAFPGASYRWQDGSTGPGFLIAAPGTYAVTLSAYCGELRDTLVVDYGTSPAVNLGSDTTLCEGETLLLDATFAGAAYQWQDGSILPSFLIQTAGTYAVTLSTACGSETDEIRIRYETLPEVALPADTTLCEGQTYRLDVSGTGNRYRWQDGSDQPEYLVREAGLYFVEVFNTCGSRSDSMEVRTVDCNCYLYLPTGFTPNNDGYNDRFSIGYQCGFLQFQLQIFNRWGEKVFESNSPDQSWDGRSGGKALPEGVYTWQVIYTYENRVRALTQVRAGTVTLIR
ncbi:MAG: gliding motility-associated C-terminal domain-containing protein [Bacteroidia bacterium]